jgi:hypothetical protein
MANSQVGARLVFENAKTLINQLGYDASSAVLTPSYIRSESLLSTSSATYQVPILVNQSQNGNQPTVRESRLQLQDMFVVSSIQFLLVSGSSTTGSAKNYTYPNLTAFSTGAAQLYNLYNGFFSIQVNNQNILPKWPLIQHLDVPQTQQNTNFNAASATSPAQYSIDQVNMDVFGQVVCEPNIVLNGASNINATLNLPAAPTTLDSNTYVATIFYGLLAQNVTSVK